jgi:hypothetical protein
VEVENGLARAWPDVHDDAIVIESCFGGRFGHEAEQPVGFFARERVDLEEACDVTLRYHEQVDGRLRSDVLDRDQAVGTADDLRRDVAPDDPAEDAVLLRQRGSPPR